MSRRARALVLTFPVAFGALVAGWYGLAMAVTSLLCALDERRSVQRLVGILAVVMGVLMAVATVTEGSLDRVGASFATDRDLAALAGQLAGVMVVLLVCVAIVDERATATPGGVAATDAGVATGAWIRFAPWARVEAATVGLIGLGAAVRGIADPEALAPVYREIAANIERGAAYGRGTGVAVAESAVVAPAAPIVAALGPFGARFALTVVGIVAAVLLVALARGIAGPRAGLIAAAVTVVLPSWWGASLPAMLVIVGVLAAASLGDPDRIDTRRAIGAGLALAFAALARPEALLASVAVVAMLLLSRRRGPAAIVVAAAAVAYAPWYLWVVKTFHTGRPTTGLGRDVAGTVTSLPWGSYGVVLDVAVVFAALAVVVLARARGGSPAVRVPEVLWASPWPTLAAMGAALMLLDGNDPAARALGLPAALVVLAAWGAGIAADTAAVARRAAAVAER
jgi:hypothetical protein